MDRAWSVPTLDHGSECMKGFSAPSSILNFVSEHHVMFSVYFREKAMIFSADHRQHKQEVGSQENSDT
jgi:hypothetical protein